VAAKVLRNAYSCESRRDSRNSSPASPAQLSAIVTTPLYAAEMLLEPFVKPLANALRAASEGTLQVASLAT
jgi:hypothetical protein